MLLKFVLHNRNPRANSVWSMDGGRAKKNDLLKKKMAKTQKTCWLIQRARLQEKTKRKE